METPPPQGRPVASLMPSLLARKGTARPAMRSQLAVMVDSAESEPAAGWADDLGWNDMGEEVMTGTVIAFPRDAAFNQPAAIEAPIAPVRRTRGSTLGKGRKKAAFTLRLDAERHLKLRLACTLDSRSAQALVIDALDRLLAEMPELAALADHVGERRQS